MLIIGKDGFRKLVLGYEVNANQIETKAFEAARNLPNGKIVPGDLLITTGVAQVYTTPDKSQSATTYEGKIAGIALATNVKLDPLFPQSADEPGFEAGQHGANLVKGEIAVKLYGSAPKENDQVYYNVAQAAFTTTAAGNLKCEGYKFSGITEGNLTVVNRLY